MKAMITLGVVSALVGARYYFTGGCCGMTCPESDVTPSGSYVEARTASVFAGACHYNSELVTIGREALLAWHFDAGRIAGTSLEGVELVAAISSSENLAQGASRKSILYVDADASAAAREAAVDYVKAHCGEHLGQVLAVEVLPLDVVLDGDRYSVSAGDVFALGGSGLPDRECCKMPYNVWYEPFAKLDARLVGNSERFAWNEARLASPFENSGHNDAFFGRFGAELASCCAPQQTDAALVTQ